MSMTEKIPVDEKFTLLGKDFLDKSIKRVDLYKIMTEKAISQITDDNNIITCIDGESNSIAIIIKHLEGNIRSRWTDFLNSDGEKPDRHRPQEFERTFNPTRQELMELWERGWIIFFDAMHSLTPEDLLKTIYVRREPLTVIDAILRQITHYTNHIGQILF